MTGQKEKLKNMGMTAKFPNVATAIITGHLNLFIFPAIWVKNELKIF
jgi:hypothetical protein